MFSPFLVYLLPIENQGLTLLTLQKHMGIKNNLLAKERVIYRTHPHWLYFISPVLVVLFGVVLIWAALQKKLDLGTFSEYLLYLGYITAGIGVISFFKEYIHHRTSEYVVTNQRVFVQEGVLGRKTTSMILSQIEAVEVDQTLVARIMNFGHVEITGSGGAASKFTYIHRPEKFRRAIQKNISFED